MPTTLQETLLTPGTKPQVVADCQALIDGEVASKSGLSGAGLKVGYKVVTSFASGYYQQVISNMLPDMVAQLESFWADFAAAGGGSFGDYLAKRGDEVAVRAYNAVRGGAAKHIEAALPSLGTLVQKYTG
jgi:hypothetical protein